MTEDIKDIIEVIEYNIKNSLDRDECVMLERALYEAKALLTTINYITK